MRRFALLLLLALVLVGQGAAHAQIEPPKGEVTSLACDSDLAPRKCSGFLAGFDGTALDADLALPASGPYPLLVFVHGWGGSKGDGKPSPSSGYPGDDFLTSKGYAVLRYSARGFGKSWGQTNLASVEVEIRDLQALVSAVVDDPRFRVLPEKVGVFGASYGGGHSWLIATRPIWTSAKGRRVRVAAVAPIVPWTDLLYSLVPNGWPAESRAPLGTMKLSYVTGLFATGKRLDPDRPYDNYIPLLPELYARVMAGEPYEAGGVRDPILEEGSRELTEVRSPAWQTGWLRAIRNDPSLRTPVFQVQGWTDDLFPVTEALRMYRLVKEAVPNYPIKLYFGDIGHPRAANKKAELDLVEGMLLAWFDYWLKGKGPHPSFDVVTSTTLPGEVFDPALLVRAEGPRALAQGEVRLEASGPFLLLNQAAQPGGLAADPIVQAAAAEAGLSLLEPLAPRLVQAGSLTPGSARVERPVRDLLGPGEERLWYLGQGRVRLRGSFAGTDAQFDVRLWDLFPDGTPRLVDRGTLKYLGNPGPFDVEIELFGNSWVFPADHTLLLEVSNVDFPYLRPNNLASSTVLDGISAALPVRRAAPSGGFSGAAAGAARRELPATGAGVGLGALALGGARSSEGVGAEESSARRPRTG